MVEIRKYRTVQGRVPFVSALRDRRAQKRVQVRIDRLALGLEGDWKPVGEEIRELRISEGRGYRVYYAWGRCARAASVRREQVDAVE